MTVTIAEAAEFAGVSVSLLRKWVLAGKLEPVRRGANPLRFHYEDVARVQREQRTQAWRTRHADAVSHWETCVSGDS